MLGRLKFLLLYFTGWVAFFELARLVFVLYNHAQASTIPGTTATLSFWYGLRMDLSMSSYILLPVCFMVMAGLFLSWFRKPVIYRWYTWLLLFFVLLAVITDLGVYQNWGFRLDATPLKYLNQPKEAWASISHLPLLRIGLAFLAVYILLCYLSGKWINRISILMTAPLKRLMTASAVLVLFTFFLIIPIRGGLQLVPINQSSVYFSNSNFANMAAINPAWNFMNGVWNHNPTKNPYRFMEADRAGRIVDSLYADSGTIRKLLNTPNPNVVVIIWESFTQKALETSVNGQPVAPGMNALKHEGVYFSHIFASGDRTDKGIAAVLGGYPALNNFSIIFNPVKSAKLNTLGGFFRDRGYHSAFYYGGETDFANIRSFIIHGGYEQMTDRSSFHGSELNSKWGAHDGVVAARMLKDLDVMPKPFFTTWLTLSSHEPFEVPEAPAITGNSITNKFLNSLHYSDEVLTRFIDSCKTRPWWKNTLFVIIADHGHPLPDPSTTIDNFRIPMIWLGGALKETGIVIDKLSSQIDLAGTLTRQIDSSSGLFPFSKNILSNSSHSWAYFSFNWGFGFMQPGRAFVFDNVGKQFTYKNGSLTNNDIDAGKAMQQFSYEDYLKK